MPPQQTNKSVPIESTLKESTQLGRRRIFWGALLTIILVLIIGIAVTVGFSNLPTTQPSSESTATPIVGSWYQSNVENIRFVVPEGWTINANANPSLPAGFKEPIFVLQKAGSACTIIEARWDSAISDTRKQISFADRVFSNWTQFDGDWWIASTSDSSKYSFSNDARQYLAGEFRVSSNLRNDPFLLFMADGTAVPDDCNSDFNALLKTFEPYYETVQLDSLSRGTLITEKVWGDTTSNTSNKSYEHLVFIADGSNEKREVMRIPADTWTGRFSVSDGKIYIPSNAYQFDQATNNPRFDSAIYILNPFAAQVSHIPGTSRTNTYISSLYLQNGSAYYLASSSALGNCLDEYRPCAADLYSIPLVGDQPVLLAHSSLGGSILGYVENESAFYIGQGWGDAGCTSTSINKIVGSKEETVGKFGECVGESEADEVAYKQMRDNINAITTKASASKTSSKGIRVENNLLQPVSSDIAGNAVFYFDK